MIAPLKNHAAHVVTGVLVLALALVLGAAAAHAQGVPVPDVAADPDVPVGATVLKVLGWLRYGCLAAALAGFFGGGIAAGVGHYGNHPGAGMAARNWLIGGALAAVISGTAHGLVTRLA